jgi:CheY-like chemotaxis protein
MMLSSTDREQAVARCRNLGLAAYLTKPITQSDLLDSLVKVLRISFERELEEAPRPATLPSIRPLRILLAEDNAVNQVLAMRLLEKHGHTVVAAGNGKEALALLEAEPFDLIFMDVQMPEMGGFEATGIIRAKEKETGQHIPIIAMTAHAMKGDRERCLAAGMDGYVTKPIQVRDLLETMQAVLEDHGPTEPASADAVPSDTGEDFNESEALQRVGGDEALLQELIGLFLEDSPRLLANVRDAIARGDAPKLKIAAHTLKGSAANFGATPTVAAAQALERLAEEGSFTGAAEAATLLEQTVERLRTTLAHRVLEPVA